MPKKIPYNNEFITCSHKIVINSNNISEKIIRHDYASRTLINLIIKLKINESPRWITYIEYINKNKMLQNLIPLI